MSSQIIRARPDVGGVVLVFDIAHSAAPPNPLVFPFDWGFLINILVNLVGGDLVISGPVLVRARPGRAIHFIVKSLFFGSE